MHACMSWASGNFLCMHAYACDGQAEILLCMHVTGKHMGPVQNNSCVYHMGLPRIFFKIF